jgi:hypothetical protein
MKNKTAYCLTATLLLFAGCDNMGTRPAIEEPEGAFQIVCFELGITNTGLFETTGAIVDEGTVEGDPLPEDVAAGTRVVRYRTFNSEKGYLAVRIEARFVTDDTRTVEGSYTVLERTGIYTRVQEEGRYHVLLDARGDPVEYFSGEIN